MTTDKITFNSICEKHKIWIIKYSSNNYQRPLYLIWYTEISKEETDKLLTYKNGKIFTCSTLNNLQYKLINEKSELNYSTNFQNWLNQLDKHELIESCDYELDKILKSIKKNRINNVIIADISNFINLFNDFVVQSKRNYHLKKYSKNELLEKVWEYYYDNIFWANSNEGDLIKSILEIDHLELATKIKELTSIFETNFNKI